MRLIVCPTRFLYLQMLALGIKDEELILAEDLRKRPDLPPDCQMSWLPLRKDALRHLLREH